MGALDLQQPAIIQQQVSGGHQNSPQDVLSNSLEQQRQIIIDGMKQYLLKNVGFTEAELTKLKFDVVGNIGIIINSKGFLNSWYKYSKENGVEYYTNFPGLQKDIDLPFALRETGYELKDGKLFIGGKEILQFLQNGSVNPEFVRGIDNINFYVDIQGIFGMIKAIQNGRTLENFTLDYFERTLVSGFSRIKEVLYFAGKGYIPQKEVPRLLKRAIAELPNQCSDMRFVRNPKGQEVGMEVTKQELDEYLHPTQGAPLITQSMYNDCLRRIEIRDRKIEEEQKLKEATKSEVKFEKARKSFSDRVKNILGF